MSLTQKSFITAPPENNSYHPAFKRSLFKLLTVIPLLLVFILSIPALAQTDSVYWSFGSSGNASAAATSSSYAGVPASGCMADTGNVCCTFTSASGYTTLYFTTNFPSSTYPGASGEPTMRNNAKTGGFNASTSTYFSFTVTPTVSTTVEIKEIHFAGLKNATGPGSYTIRTSVDGYASSVGTGTLSTSYGSSKKSHTGLSIQGTAGVPITVRIYTHNPVVTATGGNVFIDDVVIYYDATGSSITPGITTGSLSSSNLCTGTSVTILFTAAGTFNSGNTFTAELSDASGSFSSPVSIGSIAGTTSGNINATIPPATTPGSNYRIRVVSSNPSMTGTDNGSNLTIATTVVPTVAVNAAPGATICAGSSATFTAAITNGGSNPVYQWKKNSGNVGTNTNTYTDNGIANGDVITVELTNGDACATPATITSSPVAMTVNPSASNSVTITSTASTICAGTPVTFTATVPSTNNGPLVSIPGSNLTCTNSTTATSSCVGAGGFWANGWTSGGYWQYQINTTGYQDIVFNTPTSSSGTGPHNGALYYSTNGTTFTPVTTYTWSGTGCTSTGNITLPAAADNQPTLYVRLIMTGATNTSGTNRVNPDAFKGKVIQPGITPIYQWKKNGNNVGTNSNTYTDNALADNDDVWVEVSATTCVNPAVATSNIIKMTVNPVLTPSVSVAATATTICAGTSVTFTATPVNGGSSANYQWKVNGGNVGTNSNTYTSTSLANGDVVTCQLTSNAPCATPATVNSSGITMTVNPVPIPTVSITSTATAICAGVPVTFTATPVNGGASPTYQWKKNGGNVGSNSATYTDNALANGDVITVEMTSNALCASTTPVASNAINMVVSVPLTPSVTVAANPGNIICAGASVTFTATPVNGGAAPSYQWKKNNSNIGANTAAYTDNGLANGDIITVEMTSNAVCLSAPSATSTGITMTVNQVVVPAVTITVGPNDTICDGTPTTFTAVPVNEGMAPTYQWTKNNIAVGSSSTTYTDNALVNGDVISLSLASSATCAIPANVNSNTIKMTVDPLLPTSVSILPTPNDTFCAGTPVTFTAKFMNGGISPSFQWMKNNTNVGTNATTYVDNTLADGDDISVVMTSNAVCATPATVSSQLPLTVTVRPVYHPAVTLVANPGTTLAKNQMVYFTAYISDAGPNPKIHWETNGVTIPGVKGDNYFSSIMNHNDVVTCIVESTDSCSVGNTGVSNALVIKIIGTDVGDVANNFNGLSLFPNPNSGIFTIKGQINTRNNVNVEVLNAVGQIIYTAVLPVVNNAIDQKITLPETAKGAYLLRMHAEGEQKVLRFIVQ